MIVLSGVVSIIGSRMLDRASLRKREVKKRRSIVGRGNQYSGAYDVGSDDGRFPLQ